MPAAKAVVESVARRRGGGTGFVDRQRDALTGRGQINRIGRDAGNGADVDRLRGGDRLRRRQRGSQRLKPAGNGRR